MVRQGAPKRVCEAQDQFPDDGVLRTEADGCHGEAGQRCLCYSSANLNIPPFFFFHHFLRICVCQHFVFGAILLGFSSSILRFLALGFFASYYGVFPRALLALRARAHFPNRRKADKAFADILKSLFGKYTKNLFGRRPWDGTDGRPGVLALHDCLDEIYCALCADTDVHEVRVEEGGFEISARLDDTLAFAQNERRVAVRRRGQEAKAYNIEEALREMEGGSKGRILDLLVIFRSRNRWRGG